MRHIAYIGRNGTVRLQMTDSGTTCVNVMCTPRTRCARSSATPWCVVAPLILVHVPADAARSGKALSCKSAAHRPTRTGANVPTITVIALQICGAGEDCAAPTFLSCLKCSRPARTTVSVILTRAQAGPAVGQSPRPCHPSNAPRTCRPRVSRCARTRPLVPSPATALAPASIRALIWLPTPRIPQHPQHPQYPASCILFL